MVWAAGWYLLRRLGQRADRWWSVQGVRDTYVLDTLEAQFRERAADLDAWWRAQRTRLEPGGEGWYRARWRRRRYVPDDTVSWCANPPSMADHEPATRRHSEFYGTHHEPYEDTGLHADGGIWYGTGFDPYPSVDAAGKRRRP